MKLLHSKRTNGSKCAINLDLVACVDMGLSETTVFIFAGFSEDETLSVTVVDEPYYTIIGRIEAMLE